MRKEITVLKPVTYTDEKNGLYALVEEKAITKTQIMNENGKKIVDFIHAGYNLDQIFDSLDYTDDMKQKKKDILLFLRSLKVKEYIDYDDSYFDDVKSKYKVRVTELSEYNVLSKILIGAIREDNVIYSKGKEAKYYNLLKMQDRTSKKHEYYFVNYEGKEYSFIIAAHNLDVEKLPIEVSLVYSEGTIDDAVALFQDFEEYLKQIRKSKVKIVMNELATSEKVISFMDKLGYHYEGTLKKEDGDKDEVIYSKLL